MEKIYDLSWNKSGFFAKLQLFFASIQRERKKMKSGIVRERIGGYSALSSTYYSIVGSTFAQFKTIFLPKRMVLLAPILVPIRLTWFICSWFPLGAWCYYRMLPVSDKMLQIAGGYQNLSVSQCDIRQSILRKRERLSEAMTCIDSAFNKKLSGHSFALLLVGKAGVLERQGGRENFSEIKGLIYQAIEIAEKVEGDEPQQAIRIYRNCANLVKRIGEDGELLRKKAKQLAERVDAKDQLAKL